MAKQRKTLPEHTLKLTSVKVHPYVLQQFQEKSLHTISLQKLVNRAMAMYSSDMSFRSLILGYTNLVPSGSL